MLDTDSAIDRYLRTGMAAIFLLGGTATAWSMITRIDSAVVAQGTVVVESNVKKVQHPTGGVVGAIFVKEGQRVDEGAVVVRLDETATRAALGIVINELTAMRARVARLGAERSAAAEIAFPVDITKRVATEPEVKEVVQGEIRHFVSRRKVRQGLKAQFGERIGQLTEEMKGLTGQQRSLETQLDVARKELQGLSELEIKKLVPRPRITALEREIARSDGALGETIGRTHSAKSKIAEVHLQVLQLDNDHMNEVSKELRDAETRVNELQERRLAAEDQLRRIDIKAPIKGTVHQLSVHTVGGVISQTEPLMLIVPETDRLIVEVRIQPQDIDQVRVGQSARLRFTAFNQNTTPELQGSIFRIGGDLSKDPQTGQQYFQAGLEIAEQELNRLGALKLLPGMPVDAFITSGKRTVFSYLLKPLTDQMNRSLRER